MFKGPYSFITGENVARLIKSPNNTKMAVVDVRDDDFVGGNIKTARNIPSRTFTDQVADLAKEYKDFDRVLFHCALSQQRGPACALAYSKARKQLLEGVAAAPAPSRDAADILEEPSTTSSVHDAQEIQVIRGGFGEFQAAYRNDPELVENFDKRFYD